MFLCVYFKCGHDNEKYFEKSLETMANLEGNLDNSISNTVCEESVCGIILHIILFRKCFSSKHPLDCRGHHRFKPEETIVTTVTFINLGVANPM
jgi:hypothetical protein